MERLGSTNPALRLKIETMVGDVAVHMLLQNESRFKALKKIQTISVTSSTRNYRLAHDFRTISECYEVDSEGEPEGEIWIISKKEIRKRKVEGLTTGDHYGWVEKKTVDGVPGFYLTLAGDAGSSMTYELDYYRIPTTSDVPLVADVDTLKRGVIGQLPDQNPNFQVDTAVYEGRVAKIKEKEHVARVQTVNRLRPSKRVTDHNTLMRKSGQSR